MYNIYIVGPTCAGKDTLKKSILDIGDFKELKVITSRPRRPGEVNRHSYHFASKDEIEDWYNNGDLLSMASFVSDGVDQYYALPLPEDEDNRTYVGVINEVFIEEIDLTNDILIVLDPSQKWLHRNFANRTGVDYGMIGLINEIKPETYLEFVTRLREWATKRERILKYVYDKGFSKTCKVFVFQDYVEEPSLEWYAEAEEIVNTLNIMEKGVY